MFHCHSSVLNKGVSFRFHCNINTARLLGFLENCKQVAIFVNVFPLSFSVKKTQKQCINRQKLCFFTDSLPEVFYKKGGKIRVYQTQSGQADAETEG